MTKQLICEGPCNQPYVTGFDEALRLAPRAERDDHFGFVALPPVALSFRKLLKHTPHESQRTEAVCQVCGTPRRYGKEF